MPIEIKLSTTLRKYSPGYNPAKGIWFTPDHNDEISAADIARELGLPPGEIKFIMLNGRCQPLDAVVRSGDRLAFFPPVGGG